MLAVFVHLCLLLEVHLGIQLGLLDVLDVGHLVDLFSLLTLVLIHPLLHIQLRLEILDVHRFGWRGLDGFPLRKRPSERSRVHFLVFDCALEGLLLQFVRVLSGRLLRGLFGDVIGNCGPAFPVDGS